MSNYPYELCLKPTGQVLADTASAWVRPRIALSVKSGHSKLAADLAGMTWVILTGSTQPAM